MKKVLVAALAVLALGAGSAAQAQSWSFTIGNDRYEQRYDYRNEYRHRRAEERRFYSRQPTYWQNRCSRYDFVMRDPYTNRLLCVNRREYERFYRRIGAGHSWGS